MCQPGEDRTPYLKSIRRLAALWCVIALCGLGVSSAPAVGPPRHAWAASTVAHTVNAASAVDFSDWLSAEPELVRLTLADDATSEHVASASIARRARPHRHHRGRRHHRRRRHRRHHALPPRPEPPVNTNQPTTSTPTGSLPSEVVAQAPQPPASTNPPRLGGQAQQGKTLTASAGSWTGGPTAFAYQWQRCDAAGANCVAIDGANAATYEVAAPDAGSTLRVAVTATNVSGSTPAVSQQTATIA